MKISYNWLKKFVDIKQTPQKLAEDLSLFGHEVESIKKVASLDLSRAKSRDYVLDFEITPNRGDCLSILGIAREISALYDKKLEIENWKLKIGSEKLKKNIIVKISDPVICPRYSARIIENIKIDKSPKWLQDDLKKLGINPLNNIVDITNYIMLESGQPMHAFDYNKIKNGVINIRKSISGEKIQTLDSKKYELPIGAIVIDNGKNIYDLAGIMGGANSQIDASTKNIILQAAVFNPILIRQTSKVLNKTTEASYRYERGVDIANTTNALDSATELITKLCPKARIGSVVDKYQDKKSQMIRIDYKKINHLIGTNLKPSNISQDLTKLGFIVKGNDVVVPSYRTNDIKIWQDIAEEIARIYGYNKIPKKFPTKIKPVISKEFSFKEKTKDILVEVGFNETYSSSFADKRLLEKLGYKLDNLQKVINGLTPETEYLRPSLLPSLLTAIAKNPWAPEVNIFEIGKVFNKNGEKTQLGLAQIGRNSALIKSALQKLKVNKPIENVDQSILDYLKIRRPVKYVVLDLDSKQLNSFSYLRQSASTSAPISARYKPVSQFPPTIRDLAFIVSKKVDSEKVRQSIEKIDSHILLVELFDEFYFKPVPNPTIFHPRGGNRLALAQQGYKNLAYHVWLQDLKKPMNEKDTENISKKIIKNIEQKFSAKLRTM